MGPTEAKKWEDFWDHSGGHFRATGGGAAADVQASTRPGIQIPCLLGPRGQGQPGQHDAFAKTLKTFSFSRFWESRGFPREAPEAHEGPLGILRAPRGSQGP